MLTGIPKGHFLQEVLPHLIQPRLDVSPICSHKTLGISAVALGTPFWKHLFQCPFFHYTGVQCEGRNCVLDICISPLLGTVDTQ